MKKSNSLPRSDIRINTTTTINFVDNSGSSRLIQETETIFSSKDSGTISGVYEIRNKITGERYIGTSRNIRRRFTRHKEELINRTHHCYLLQRDFDNFPLVSEVKNPDDFFEFNVIVYCRPSELFHYEHMIIKTIKPEYNTHMENGHSRARIALKEESGV